MTRKTPPAWYYADSSRSIGPLSIQGLKETLVTLPDAKNVLVWCEGFLNWKIAGDVQELRARSLTPPPVPKTHFCPLGGLDGGGIPSHYVFLDRLGTDTAAKQWLGELPNVNRLG
jgi:hypothetical protein